MPMSHENELDEVRPSEVPLLLAYRRCSERHQHILRFLANYFSSIDDEPRPPAEVIPLRRTRGEP